MTFRWPWRLNLTSNHQTNIFIWFLDPKNPLKMVSFVILTYFIFPIWPPAAILNFSKRSIVRIGHHVRNWSLDTILHESSVKKTISVGNWFSQKRPNFPQTTVVLADTILTIHTSSLGKIGPFLAEDISDWYSFFYTWFM